MTTRIEGSVIHNDGLFRKKKQVPVDDVVDINLIGWPGRRYRLGEKRNDELLVIDFSQDTMVILGSKNLKEEISEANSHRMGYPREAIRLDTGQEVVVSGIGKGINASITIKRTDPSTYEI